MITLPWFITSSAVGTYGIFSSAKNKKQMTYGPVNFKKTLIKNPIWNFEKKEKGVYSVHASNTTTKTHGYNHRKKLIKLWLNFF